MPESTTPATATGAPASPLLDVRGLTKEFEQRAGPFGSRRRLVRALDRVSFTIARGETLGLVGESGSGKTTAGRCALRLVEPTAGTVLLHPREDAASGAAAPPSDFTAARGGALLALRRRTAMVFQDPQSFLSPRMTVGEIVAEPLVLAGERRGPALQEKVAALLSEVGLSAAEMARPPQALSGGQKQRVGFARALALSPELVVADEPVSALDVSVRAQILALTASLKASRRVAWLFIGHDLRVVAHVSDRIAVMYLGRIVEVSPTADLFARPRHPYTESLLAAIPIADPAQRGRPRRALQGDPPSPADPPRGCAFHPRCAYAQEICAREEPPLIAIGGGTRQAACHFATDLTLSGARA